MPRLVPPVVEPGALASMAQPTIPVDGDVHLRPFQLGDVEAVRAAFADPDIQRWHCRRIDDVVEAQAWVEATHRGWEAERAATWAVAVPGGEVLGRVTLYLRLADGWGEVSYWILPAARGRGAATRAVQALTRWGEGAVGLHRVELRHSVRNRASCRVAVRAGFRPEGTLRGALLHADGWHDVHLHAHVDERGRQRPDAGEPAAVRRPGGW